MTYEYLLSIQIISNRLINKPEVWEAIREGMGKLWRICLGRNSGVRKGGWSVGYEESSGPRIEERRGVKRGRRYQTKPVTHT